jgi:ABC-type Fe3+-hydroxamate transport system substrate-binding protein
VIVVGTHSDDGKIPLQPLLALTALPAVRDHRVSLIDGDLLFRPGPRAAEGVEALERALVSGRP